MQQHDIENSSKDVLVLIDYRSALLPFCTPKKIKPFLEGVAKVSFPVISINHPDYLPLAFLTFLQAGFLELPPELAPKNKKPAAIIIDEGDKIERISFLTQDAQDSQEKKRNFNREPLKWGARQDDQFPNIAVLPSEQGFPISRGFEIAAAEFGHSVRRTIYIAGAHYEGGLRAAHRAGVQALSVESLELYRPIRTDGKFGNPMPLSEVIQEMIALIPA